MIACDEADNIDACLQSASQDVDEIIVVDTGSRDRTRSIARRHGARDRGYHTVQLYDACAASVKENHDAIYNMIRTHPEAFGLMGTSDAFVNALTPVAAAVA